ncbi:transcription factor A, mitochondrial [Pelobates fuscus]|uniref:transcription factor A, mitochondrial n=1 Tax=Pelobates fuscus TaxID=191477 RepID=UPI002FE4C1AD
MVSILSRGFGHLVRSLAELSFTPRTSCNNLLCGVSAVQCSATRWFSKTHKSDDHLKRPLTGYIRYSIQQQPLLSKKYPGAKITELAKMIAQEWRGLPASVKEPYLEAAKSDLKIYVADVKKYKATLSPVELQALREERKHKRSKRIAIRKKRELSSLGKPKRPRSAFNIFMSEHFHEAKGASVPSKLKNVREDWRCLNDSQKQAYIQLAEDDKIRYENEMKSWEDQMIEIGREDLVRRKKKLQLAKLKAESKMQNFKGTLKHTDKSNKFKEGKNASSITIENEE